MLPMKTWLAGIAVVVALLVGCRRQPDPPGQWIFESYSADNGYVFRKDGVQYKAHCGGVVWTKDSGDWDVNEKVSESDCAAVLPFLHKVIPLKPGGEPDIVHFDRRDPGITWTYGFKIMEAK